MTKLIRKIDRKDLIQKGMMADRVKSLLKSRKMPQIGVEQSKWE